MTEEQIQQIEQRLAGGTLTGDDVTGLIDTVREQGELKS